MTGVGMPNVVPVVLIAAHFSHGVMYYTASER